MLSRTPTLLPGALFTPLPGVRAEHLSDAMRVCNSPSVLTPQPTSITGHRPRPKARLRDRHIDRLRAALRTPARIHGPPSLTAKAAARNPCWTTRSAPDVHATFARASHASAVRTGWPYRRRARAARGRV